MQVRYKLQIYINMSEEELLENSEEDFEDDFGGSSKKDMNEDTSEGGENDYNNFENGSSDSI